MRGSVWLPPLIYSVATSTMIVGSDSRIPLREAGRPFNRTAFKQQPRDDPGCPACEWRNRAAVFSDARVLVIVKKQNPQRERNGASLTPVASAPSFALDTAVVVIDEMTVCGGLEGSGAFVGRSHPQSWFWLRPGRAVIKGASISRASYRSPASAGMTRPALVRGRRSKPATSRSRKTREPTWQRCGASGR